MTQNNKLIFSEFWVKNKLYIRLSHSQSTHLNAKKLEQLAQKSVDDFNYTSVCFEYHGEAVPPLRINGSFRIFKFKNSKGTIYSLSINCDESLGEFFNELLPMKPVGWFPK